MGYGQIMARTGQQVVSEIREDLFRHTQGFHCHILMDIHMGSL